MTTALYVDAITSQTTCGYDIIWDILRYLLGSN